MSVLAPRAGRIVAPVTDRQTRIRTPDGLYLSGSLFTVDGARRAAVLVHGGGVTREEGGFFTRLAIGLGDAGMASLRFDLRATAIARGVKKT